MGSTTTLVTLEEYLRTSYEPDREYVDGVLVSRNVGTQLHSLLQTLVVVLLHSFRQSHKITVFTECRLSVSPTGRHRIPDVMVLEDPYTRGKVVTNVPAVVIEIKSPDDTFDEILNKCLEYAELGVPNILVLDPDHRRSYSFHDRALELVPSPIPLHLLKSGGTLLLPAEALFAELDAG